MSLDLRNFVQVNINYQSINVSSVEKGIVTLITKNLNFSDNQFAGKIFYSLSEYNKFKEDEEIAYNDLDLWVKAFFANKGKGLQIIGGRNSSPEENIQDFLSRVLESLDYKYVIVVSDADEEDLRKVAELGGSIPTQYNPITKKSSVDLYSGINEKLFISSTTDTSGNLFDKVSVSYDTISSKSVPEWEEGIYYSLVNGQYVLLTAEPADWPDAEGETYACYKVASTSIENYGIKVGEKGIEMLAAAYLSQAKISDPNTINDYAFTIENLSEFQNSLINNNLVGSNLISKHFNFDTYLVNEVRNYPGDLIKGADLMNYYIRIILTQDLTEGIMDLLASKIRFNQAGLNRLNNTISQIMSRYIDNGYLNTDYIWTKDDLYYTFNDTEYLVCARNTPLVKGYKAVILPLTSLTEEQKEAHVLPPVYMLLATSKGIRMVVIKGDLY